MIPEIYLSKVICKLVEEKCDKMQVKLNNNVTIVGETVKGDYLFTYKSYDGTFKLASYNPDNISSDAVEVAF